MAGSNVAIIEKGFNVLSIDGGGSKGVMEVIILQDVMNMVTLLKRNPQFVLDKVEGMLMTGQGILFGNENDRDEFIKELKQIQDPIHPVECFDMIVGTSTGNIYI